MTDERITRPELDRDHPFRRVGEMWSSVGGGQGPDDPLRGRAGGGSHGEREGSRSEFVADGVRSAYRVIDEYLNQGQRVARQIGSLSYGPMKLGASNPEVQGRWVQLTSELIANWFDLLGLVTETLAPSFEGEEASPEHRATPVAPSTQVHVSVEIASKRPALIEVGFQPGRDTVNVASHGLQNLGGGETIPVEFNARDHGTLIVRLSVPDDQPPGLYTGVLVVPETGAPVGTVSLTLR
jgi:hypothetical protein